MTYEQALAINQNLTPKQVRNDLERYLLRGEAPIVKGVAMAMQALEKQIPKKPIKKNPICYVKTKDGQEYFVFDYFCPNCNEQIKPSEHHCYCGQALEWGDTE